MGNAARKRFFFGKNDPNKVLLESVFPLSDVSFATPIHGEGMNPRIVVEGNTEHMRILEEHLEDLVANTPRERYFGRWKVLVPDEITGGLSLFYDPESAEINKMELLVFVLRRHLVKTCNLRLAPIGLITATWNEFEIDLSSRAGSFGLVREIKPVPLPEDIGNGTIELPVIILPSRDALIQ